MDLEMIVSALRDSGTGAGKLADVNRILSRNVHIEGLGYFTGDYSDAEAVVGRLEQAGVPEGTRVKVGKFLRGIDISPPVSSALSIGSPGVDVDALESRNRQLTAGNAKLEEAYNKQQEAIQRLTERLAASEAAARYAAAAASAPPASVGDAPPASEVTPIVTPVGDGTPPPPPAV